MGNKFSIYTLGCKVNQAESDWIASMMSRKGFKHCGFAEDCDFCIINTCTVTSKSDKKTRQMIRKAKKKDCMVIVTGCFVEFNKGFLESEDVKYIPNKDKEKIPQIIEDMKNLEANIKDPRLHARPLIKIQDGCEQFCSYCIIPLVRGKYRSVEPGLVLENIENASGAGYGEVVLTGIHIGKYGIDFKKDYRLLNLLEDIIENTEIKRIRLGSVEIDEISSELATLVMENERMAPHLHIPLQSGSNKILNLMGRPYSREYFLKKIKGLKGLAITTDVMVGFPQESGEDFKKTCGLVEEIGFSKLHVFKYSKRERTKAYSMEGQIPSKTKKSRSRKLISIGKKLRENFLNSNIARILDVVYESHHNGTGYGTSGNYIKIYFNIKGDIKEGRIIRVKTSHLYKNGLWGDMYIN